MTPRKRLLRAAIATAAFVTVVVCAAALPYAGSALVVSSPLSSPDAIVSLASHEWERLPAAAELARRHPRALVVLTLPQTVTEFNCHDCVHRAERLMNAGVEVGRIRVVPLTLGGTFGEARAVRAFVAEHHLKSVLVVTSPYHTSRSLATFRHVLRDAGAAVGVVPASKTSPARPELWWVSPYDRAYVPYEWAARVHYQLWHGIKMS